MRASLCVLVFALSGISVARASSLDRELLRRVLVTAHPEVAACRLPPERYVVRLVLEGDGSVSEVTLREPFDASAAATRCITRAFERLTFPSFGPRPTPAPGVRPGEPRSHLPPASRSVGHVVVTWPFIVRVPEPNP